MIDTEASTLGFVVNGGEYKLAFSNIPSVFFAAVSLGQIGDSVELVHITLPKSKLLAVGQGSDDSTEQELKILSEVKESPSHIDLVSDLGRFIPIDLDKAGKKINSSYFEIKDNILRKTQTKRYTAVLETSADRSTHEISGISYGKCYWVLRMSNVENPGTQSQNFIGVVDADATSLNINAGLGVCGYAITCVGDKIVKVANDKQCGVYAHHATFGPNDLIRVTVNMRKDKRELSFAINDQGIVYVS